MHAHRVVSGTGMLAAVAGLAIAGRFALTPALAPPVTQSHDGLVLPPAPAPATSDADSLARAIAARNPFRLHRSPAAVAFDPSRADGAPPPAAPMSRPVIALAGVVLGAEPAALLDGLPGVEGTRLVRLGERVAGYVLRDVTVRAAVLRARDTTLVLLLRSPTP